MEKAKAVATVAPGIYKLEDGSYRVVAHVGNRRLSQRCKEKRFAAGSFLRDMKRWDGNTRAALSREGLRLRRDTIEGEEVRQQVVSWEAEGLAASTINHRLSALSQLFEVLDGKNR